MALSGCTETVLNATYVLAHVSVLHSTWVQLRDNRSRSESNSNYESISPAVVLAEVQNDCSLLFPLFPSHFIAVLQASP